MTALLLLLWPFTYHKQPDEAIGAEAIEVAEAIVA